MAWRRASKACTGKLKARIEETFGSVDAFKDAFIEEGVGHFGSGWSAWLVMGSDGLKVITTHDAEDTLVKEGLLPAPGLRPLGTRPTIWTTRTTR